ncbi:MAG TPA: hypothetical protein VG205_00650, partial [Acidimicrobiales bacterium]|nr:hypothetical protein [Acidimicrobiales bacterium]
ISHSGAAGPSVDHVSLSLGADEIIDAPHTFVGVGSVTETGIRVGSLPAIGKPEDDPNAGQDDDGCDLPRLDREEQEHQKGRAESCLPNGIDGVSRTPVRS